MAKKQLEKMKKKGLEVQLSGRKIAESSWGNGWCDHMESFSDYANRLPRGRSYIRNGSVCHLAIVSGSTLYNVKIIITPLNKAQWECKGDQAIGVQRRTLAALQKAWALTVHER